jgi:hypothetical protein
MPQRLFEDRIRYRGPALTTERIRKHHMVIAVGLFTALVIVAMIILLNQAPIR